MKIRDLYPGSPLDRKRIDQNNIDNSNKAKKSEQARKASSGDRTQISDEAKQLQQAAKLIEESVEELKRMPDVRTEAVNRARERVQSGYYDDPEILNSIAGVITEHMNADGPISTSDLATDIIAQISPEHSKLTRVDLEDIQGKIEQNLYQNEVVIEKVTQRILQFLKSLPEND
ncbi:MAG TPA: flagellar biosynthesis anti-sigma factor FlgM [bacterium]|nr:flagellar biosynthesis anti-sigma factor FlgM [bacterium]